MGIVNDNSMVTEKPILSTLILNSIFIVFSQQLPFQGADHW